MPACVIAVIHSKGGVGKSTICANLTGEFAALPNSVVVALDLDAQRTLTDWAQAGAGGRLRDLVRPVEVNGHDPVKAFREAVNRARETADYVFLDCPAGVNQTAMLAALTADVALIPVTPSPADLLALREPLGVIREAQLARNGRPVIALVPSRISRTTLGAGLPESLAGFGEVVLPGIGQRIAHAQTILKGLTIREYLGQTDPSVIEFSTLATAVAKLARSA